MARKYKINEEYFDKIDTETKAYLLGFIYADGCIIKPSKGRQPKLSVGIQWSDRYVTELLSQEISPENKVKKVHAPSMIKAGHSPQARWACSSQHMSDSLHLLGCASDKTKLGLFFPTLNADMIQHFIRGFFDGDGGITVDIVKNRYVRKTSFNIKEPFKAKLRKRAYFCSSDKAFLDFLISSLPSLKGKVQTIYKRGCYTYTIEHQEDIKVLYTYLYQNATIYLQRKIDKFNMTIKSQAEDTSSEGLETT